MWLIKQTVRLRILSLCALLTYFKAFRMQNFRADCKSNLAFEIFWDIRNKMFFESSLI